MNCGEIVLVSIKVCGRRYLEPTTGVASKVGTGRPSGHPRPPGDEGDSCRRRLGYNEPDAGQAQPGVSKGMATWVQTVNKPVRFSGRSLPAAPR